MRMKIQIDIENISPSSHTFVEFSHASFEIVSQLVDFRSTLIQLSVGWIILFISLRLFLLLKLLVVHVISGCDEILGIGLRVLRRKERKWSRERKALHVLWSPFRNQRAFYLIFSLDEEICRCRWPCSSAETRRHAEQSNRESDREENQRTSWKMREFTCWTSLAKATKLKRCWRYALRWFHFASR